MHHVYDPTGRVLHLGTGERRAVDNVSTQITRFAGGNFGLPGDGGPATQARVNFSCGLAIAPDGTVYFSEIGESSPIDTDLPDRVAPRLVEHHDRVKQHPAIKAYYGERKIAL